MKTRSKIIAHLEDVMVSADIDVAVTMQKRSVEADVYEYDFFFQWDPALVCDGDPRISMHWSIPNLDVMYMWHPNSRNRRVLDANWRLKIESKMTASAPLALLFNASDENTFTFATSEVKKATSVLFGVEDSDDTISGEITFGLAQFAGADSEHMIVRADYRRLPYYRVLDDVRAWWEKTLDFTPMPVPDTARLPVYSSWYNFHQAIDDRLLEAECEKAKALGMHSIIVDDGWHTENNTNGGYAYTGDWEICEKKFPNMREHVARVHALGMKYVMWYSVPFIGYYAQNWDRFKDKLLYRVERNKCGVLDPRYHDVREFLIEQYCDAVRKWDIDGLKLDFIDQFELRQEIPIAPQMDYICVQDAAERLMMDVMRRVREIKPEVLIEFRQRYIGPTMRKFGNMFRVSDCPSDIATNRVGVVDLRLLSGDTACHSDMLTWNDEESVENAALQILNVLFGVIQFSKRLDRLTPAHRKMTAFWLAFAAEHREILQKGEFVAEEPQFMYPVIRAAKDGTEIIGVYARHKLVRVDASRRVLKVINATPDERVILELSHALSASVTAYDASGEAVWEKHVQLDAGLAALSCPRSGMLVLQRD